MDDFSTTFPPSTSHPSVFYNHLVFLEAINGNIGSSSFAFNSTRGKERPFRQQLIAFLIVSGEFLTL